MVGYTKYGTRDYTFNLSTSSLVGRTVDLTFVGVPGTGVSLYLNGQLIGTDSVFIPLARNTIGANSLLAPNVKMDEILLYNRALSPAEILSHVESSGIALVDPVAIQVSPDNKNVYVAEGGMSGTLQVYSRDSNTGKLTNVQTTQTGLQFASDLQLALSSDGKSLYAAGHTGLIVEQRDQSTGELAFVQNATDQPAADVVVSPATSVFSTQYILASEPTVNDVKIFTRADNGTLTELSALTDDALDQPGALAFSPDGRFLFVANQASQPGQHIQLLVYGVAAQNGLVEGVPVSYSDALFGNAAATSITVSPDGAYLYVVNGSSPSTYVFSINSTTGKLTSLTRKPEPWEQAPPSCRPMASRSTRLVPRAAPLAHSSPTIVPRTAALWANRRHSVIRPMKPSP